jgi:hypothetical protein
MAPRIKEINEQRHYRVVGALFFMFAAIVAMIILMMSPKDAGSEIQQRRNQPTSTACATVPATDAIC